MAGRAALLFVGVILVGVFLNLYYLIFSMFAVAALGVESKLVLDAAFWLCLVIGMATTYYILRGPWANAVATPPSRRKSPKD